MVTPEQWAASPEPGYDSVNKDVYYQTDPVDQQQPAPDVITLPDDEFRAYINWTALSGDAVGAGPGQLISIRDGLYDSQRYISSEIARLTSEVTLLQDELPVSENPGETMNLICAHSDRLYSLYAQIEHVGLRSKWIQGYIDDRQPK